MRRRPNAHWEGDFSSVTPEQAKWIALWSVIGLAGILIWMLA